MKNRISLFPCGYETWFLIPSEEHACRLQVVWELTRVLRISGPKKDKLTRGWGKLDNNEFQCVNLSQKGYRLTEKDNMDRTCNKYTEYRKHIWKFNKKISKATTLWDQGTEWRITWNWVYINKEKVQQLLL